MIFVFIYTYILIKPSLFPDKNGFTQPAKWNSAKQHGNFTNCSHLTSPVTKRETITIHSWRHSTGISRDLSPPHWLTHYRNHTSFHVFRKHFYIYFHPHTAVLLAMQLRRDAILKESFELAIHPLRRRLG